MTRHSGAWGSAIWGGDVWGMEQAFIPISGVMLSQALIDGINQAVKTPLNISAVVLFSGIDVSHLVESIRVSRRNDGTGSSAMLVLIGSETDAVINFTEIEIRVTVGVNAGGAPVSFSNLIFSGYVKTISRYPGLESKSVTITASEQQKDSDLSGPPQQSEVSGSSTSAAAIIAAELQALGLSRYQINIADYVIDPADSPDGVFPLNYSTSMQMIYSLAGAIYPADVFSQPDGTVAVISRGLSGTPTWQFKKTGQTKNAITESAADRFNRVVVRGLDGTEQIYNDLVDQASYGVLETFADRPSVKESVDLLTAAENVAENSQKASITIETPINPFVGVGDLVTVENQDDAVSNVRIESISHSLSWPAGAWTTFSGVVLS